MSFATLKPISTVKAFENRTRSDIGAALRKKVPDAALRVVLQIKQATCERAWHVTSEIKSSDPRAGGGFHCHVHLSDLTPLRIFARDLHRTIQQSTGPEGESSLISAIADQKTACTLTHETVHQEVCTGGIVLRAPPGGLHVDRATSKHRSELHELRTSGSVAAVPL